MRVLNRAFDNPMILEEKTSILLAGGIVQHGYQCGMIWGATLAAGAQAYRLHGPGPQSEAKAIIAAQRLVDSFIVRNKNMNCLEITHIDKSSSPLQMITFFLIKGGTIGCIRMAAKYAKVAFRDIDAVLSEENIEVPDSPVSCSAMLAKKMGVSELHTAMVAGFAGGIGLSGGACGALGAAIWINAMNRQEEGKDKINFNDSKTRDIIENFLKCSDFKFECSEIVGRKFKNIDDHACYLRDGGCSKIIELLAAL